MTAPRAADDVAGWLRTAGDELAATIAATPDATVRPSATASAHARAHLASVSSLGPGGLTVLRSIGQGGMGQVHLAEQTALHRLVAVKTLHPDAAASPSRRDEAALALLREAWITGSLEHPNVVPVHALGLDDAGLPVLVLKRIEGTEWSALAHDADAVRARFGAPDLLAWNLGILDRVLDALRLAHSRGILHRDLKPSNVMIGEFGEVYLLDWGLAVSLRDDGTGRFPLARDVVDLAGTPSYMAPEMLGALAGSRTLPLSERTDVYLAGAVLFELLAGRPPHRGDGALAILASVALSEPDLPDDAPDELARICRRALHADPDARFASVDELQQALREYATHAGSARLAVTAHARLDELAALAATPSPDDTTREGAYRLLGACRFGFQEALAAWPDNAGARAGLARATALVAELELAADDPRTALRLLGELEDPPPALLARARAAAEERARREASLARLQQDLDLNIGTRTRAFLALLLGVVFQLVLGTAQLADAVHPRTHVDWAVWTVGITGVVAALAVWARDSMTRTLVNRRATATLFVVTGAQLALFLGGASLGVPLPVLEVQLLLTWTLCAVFAALMLDLRMWPTAAAMAAGYAWALAWPTHRMVAMSAANLVMTANLVWTWRPATLRLTAEERRALAARRDARVDGRRGG